MYPYGKSYGTNAVYNAAEDYRYGFNGMEKEKNMDASGDITDFGARVFDANFPMFLSRDPLQNKFPEHSTFSFVFNNPIKLIDEEGEQPFDPTFFTGQLWKSTGITKQSSEQIVKDFDYGLDKAGRITQDVIIIGGGVLVITVAIVGTGGLSTAAIIPIASGLISIAGGGAKLYNDIKGDYKTSSTIPSTFSGSAIFTVNKVVGEEVISYEIMATVESIESVISLKNIKLNKLPNDLESTTKLVNAIDDLTGIVTSKDELFKVTLGVFNFLKPNELDINDRNNFETMPSDNTGVEIKPIKNP